MTVVRSLLCCVAACSLFACYSTGGSASETDTPTGTETDDSQGTTTDDTTTSGTTGEVYECSLGEWQGNTVDNRPPSADPPCDFEPEQVPMFVVLGWDDNAEAGGMQWSVDLASAYTNPDGSPVEFSYYNTSTYVGAAGASWKAAYDAGHEMGNHTITHTTSNNSDGATWTTEMQGCHDAQVGLGIDGAELYGFRAPFLSTSDATITTVQEMGYWYDCSLEEGYQYNQDGTNFLWPYTLDEGSPGNDLVADEWMSATKGTVTPHPGLWEMPSYALMVPDDAACAELGIEPGLQERIQANIMESEGWE